MEKLRGIIFGWEGVLVDTQEAYFRSVNNVLKRRGHREISRETFDLVFVKGSIRMFIVLGYGADAELLAKERRKEYREIVEQLARKKPGSVEILQQLKSWGFRVAIATNSHRLPLERLVEKFGMRDLVDAVVTLDEALVAKPNPHMVKLACENVGLAPLECAIVGDRTTDMRAGKEAGVVCVGLAKDEAAAKELFEAGAGVAILDLSGLLELVQP